MADRIYKAPNYVCPILGFKSNGKDLHNCLGPICSWWVKETRRCAITDMCYKLDKTEYRLRKTLRFNDTNQDDKDE